MNDAGTGAMAGCACRICGGTNLRAMYSAKGYPVAGCADCSFVQVTERPDDSYLGGLYSELQDKHAKFRDASATDRENQRRVDLVRRFLPRGSIVLDAGCSIGDFIVRARDELTMYGVDVSRRAIEIAASRNPGIGNRLRAARLEDVGEGWPLFDAVCMWDVIEHLWDPAPVCRQLLRLVKPGGFLFVSTPDVDSLTARVMKSKWAFMIPPYHLGFFSRRSFGYLFGKRAPAELVFASKGKWTSLAFFLYKLNQISKGLAPDSLLERTAGSAVGRLNFYIPTNAILYLAAKKP